MQPGEMQLGEVPHTRCDFNFGLKINFVLIDYGNNNFLIFIIIYIKLPE